MIDLSLYAHSLYLLLAMSNSHTKKQRTHLKQQQPVSYRTMEKSTPLRSKSKIQPSDQMAKSFYSKGLTEEKQTTFIQSAHSFTASKVFKNEEFALKKHQNKKFDKLASLVTYAINSADKALKFLNISCNFQAEFACKLYYSDRQNLMKEFNKFSIQECISAKNSNSSLNSSDIKVLPFDQSVLLAESKHLKYENEQLKKELIIIEGQLGKDQRSSMWQSRSNHSFFSQHQPSQFKNLLMNKSCEEQLLKSEFDFVEREHRRMQNLLIKICKNHEINEFLQLIKKQSKYKLESLNSQHSFGQRNSFDNLSIVSEKKIEALQEKILGQIERIRKIACQHENIYKQSNKLREVIQTIVKNIDLDLQFTSKADDMINLAQSACKSYLLKKEKELMQIRTNYENDLAKKLQNIQQIYSQKENQFDLFLSERDISLDILLADKQSLLQELEDTQRTNNELMQEAKQLYTELKEFKLIKQKEQQQFQEDIGSMKEEIVRLKEQATYDMASSERILQINEELERSCNEKQMHLQNEKQQNTKLQSKLQSKRRQAVKKDKEIQHKSQIITELQKRFDLIVSSSQQKFRQMEQEIAKMSAERNHLCQQLQQSQYNLKLSNDYLLIQTNKLQQTNLNCSSLKDQMQSIQQSAKQAKEKGEEIRLLKQQKCLLQVKIKDQQRIIDLINRQKEQLVRREQLKKAEREPQHKEIKEKLQSMLLQNKKLKEQLSEYEAIHQKQKEGLQENVKHLIAQKEELQKIINNSRQQFTENYVTLQQQIEHLRQQNEFAEIEIGQLKKSIFLLKEEVKSKEIQKEKISQQKIKLIKEREGLQNKYASMDIYHENTLFALQDCHKKQILAFESEISALRATIVQGSAVIASMKQRQKLNLQQMAIFEATIKDLKTKYEKSSKYLQDQQQSCKEQLNIIEANYIGKLQQINDLKLKLQQQNQQLKQQISHKNGQIAEKVKEIQMIQLDKESIINKHKQQQLCLKTQIQTKIQQIQYLSQANIALQSQIKERQAVQVVMEDLAKPSTINQHISIISKEDSNNFQDFSEYIQQKMEDSFISIIYSQPMKSYSQSKAQNILQYLQPPKNIKSQQSQDEFEDFSSSHHRTEDIMYSMDSYHEQQRQLGLTMTFNPSGLEDKDIAKFGDRGVAKKLQQRSLDFLTPNDESGPLYLSLENSQRLPTQKSEQANWMSNSLTVGIFSKAEEVVQHKKQSKKIRRNPKKFSLFKEQKNE